MIRWGDKYELKPPKPGLGMHMDNSVLSPMWPMQVVEGPFHDDFEDMDKWVVRYKDGHTLLLPEEQINTMRRIGDPLE